MSLGALAQWLSQNNFTKVELKKWTRASTRSVIKRGTLESGARTSYEPNSVEVRMEMVIENRIREANEQIIEKIF